MCASHRKSALNHYKHQRLRTIRLLNDLEERIAALEVAEKMFATRRVEAIQYGQNIIDSVRLDDPRLWKEIEDQDSFSQ